MIHFEKEALKNLIACTDVVSSLISAQTGTRNYLSNIIKMQSTSVVLTVAESVADPVTESSVDYSMSNKTPTWCVYRLSKEKERK